MHIFIDSGSTHNFLDERLVRRLGFDAEPTTGFDVAIGDGTKLAESLCRRVGIRVQEHYIIVDLYPLAQRGANIVLVAQWLQSLGPVTFDFQSIWMKFKQGNKDVQLDGIRSSLILTMQPMVGLPCAYDLAYLLQLGPVEDEPQTSSNSTIELSNLLDNFSGLFEEPQELPSSRAADHRIEIIPGAAPANIRPYRYPHVQKEVISKMVAEILEQGFIQPSHSSYSSPYFWCE